jgi:dUTP pyrophosphatase
MIIKFKKTHKDAKTPEYSLEGDGCLDLFACQEACFDSCGNFEYNTGISMEIPEDHVGLLFPRSSITKTRFMLGNSVGVIDSNYRGDIIFKFTTIRDNFLPSYRLGDKIGQILVIPRPKVSLEEVDNLSSTNRGAGGFGSTGN